MVDPVTTNKSLAIPTRGSDVGTWDTPVNGNMNIIDNSFGGVTTIPLTNSNIILSSAQYQCVFITFTGAISANISITLPAIGSFYTIQNLTSNTSAFGLTMTTTAAGSQAIGLPPGEPIDIMTDGSNVKFKSLDKVGSYWDYAGSSVPSWVSACTVPPYLNCDGTAFSSATYPVLTTILGSTTLPDLRGRYRAFLNQGTGRIVSTGSGLDGNTIFATGTGVRTLSSANMPPIQITDPGHTHQLAYTNNATGTGGDTKPTAGNGTGFIGTLTSSAAFTGITAGSTSPQSFVTTPPSQIAGICLIRAA